MPLPDQHTGLSRHARMNRILRKPETKGIVLRRCSHTPDRVTRIDVLQVQLNLSLLEKFSDPLLEVFANVSQPHVA